MGGKNSSEKKVITGTLSFQRVYNGNTSKFILVEGESHSNLDTRAGLYYFYHANYYLYEELELTKNTWLEVPAYPGGPTDNPITIDIVKYQREKKDLCKELIEKCVNTPIHKMESKLPSLYKQYLEKFRHLKRKHQDLTWYYWNSSRGYYVRKHRQSICEFLTNFFQKSSPSPPIPGKYRNIRWRDEQYFKPHNVSLRYAYSRE